MRLLTATLPLLSLLLALPCRAGDLNVTLEEIRASTGRLTLALVDSAEGWDGKARPTHATVGVPGGDTQAFTLKDIPPGRYALLVTHDENGNGKLDTNMLGMPTEGYGFSNNPQVMRKPTWDEAAFEIGAAGATIVVQLR